MSLRKEILSKFCNFFFSNLGSNIRDGAAWKQLYVPTHARGAPYFIGFLAGYAYYKTRNSQRRMKLVNFIQLALIFGTSDNPYNLMF